MNSRPKGGLAQHDKNEATDKTDGYATRQSPWKTYGGIWKKNPDFDAFLRELDKVRRETDKGKAEP